MNRILFILCLLFSVSVSAQNIPPKPNPPRLVNDLAEVMSADQVEALERKLVAYDDSTSTQIVIVTIKSLGDYDEADVALKILRDWGVGNKNNNGIVILASIEDRKIRIETGYGMEGAVPDITANTIIDNEMTPNFRAGNYYRGFDEATDAIFRAAAGEYKAPEGYNQRSRQEGKGGLPIGFIILIIILISIFSRRGGGGGRGGMMNRRGFNPFLGGLLGGFLAGRGSSGWSGGGWSGGGGGGWSGGGGGFGGFGGGSGGGGGASGSW